MTNTSINLKKRKMITSESVTEGHPDKLADQISDAVLDAVLASDAKGRVACEALLTKDQVIVAGEITANCKINIKDIVRELLFEVGYDDDRYGFNCNRIAINQFIQEQSQDISEGLAGIELGAGDQGIMFGFATNETPEYMPLTIMLAHALAKRLAFVRKNKIIDYLGPDGKTQVTVEYDDNDMPIRLDTIVVSTQHLEHIKHSLLVDAIKEEVISQVVPLDMLDSKTKIIINPAGRFVIGGPAADTGLTGRKVIVDTYGGLSKHGGGAFSGKDPTKVDRSAAYMTRYIAKNIVAAGICQKCELQIAYAIGLSEPVSLNCNSFGTATISDVKIEEFIKSVFDLRPSCIIQELKLNRAIYRPTAAYGHFGRPEFTWEKLDKVEALKALAKTY